MAPVQSSPRLLSEHMASKKTSSPCHQGMTPPDSPTKESTTPRDTVEDLKYLFESVLLSLTNREPPNTPVFQDYSQPGPDMVQLKQLLVKVIRKGYFSAEPPVANEPSEPSQPCFSGDEQAENAQVADEIDLEIPICTTPDDFKSFKKWALKSQFKTIVETWDKEACKYKIAEPTETSNDLDDYTKYAFIVRERIDRTSKEVVPFIDIKSEGLRDILRDVLHDIKAVSLIEDKPSIEQNFLFHFLPELDRYTENMDSSSDNKSAHAEHLLLLIDHLKHTHTSALQRLKSMLQHGHITYDLLWALFKPSCHIYTTCIGTKEPRCVVFDAGEEMTQNDETWLNLKCRFLDYNGVKFGEAGIFLRVTKFRGSKPIETLKAFPLHHHPNHEQVRKDLIERGQKFRDLAGSHVQHCKGSVFFMNKGKAIKVNINSRVAVDAAFFHKIQPNYSRPSLRDIGVKDKNSIAVIDIGAILMEDRERAKERMQGDVECAVSALREVHWSPKSFDCLKIPSETKTILLSLAKTRLGIIPTVPFDDVINRKGQGFNILLNSPPGVGKTFTVEATSEYFKLPLYSISAGELIINHGDSNALEQQLKTVFKIAKHFNAVLLLDEADAFIEQRTSYHDTHNRLMTIFLRKLEYYQGILFLTSNRGIQFDNAILSRIHLVTEGWFQSSRTLQPFHVLQVNDKQTAIQVIPQYIAPLTIAVDNSVRLEHGHSFVVLPLKEAGIFIVDDMLKSRSRPAQDHHLRHEFAMVPI
ncbi:hypothetical protein DTO013E5_44 [Penicillium roqueforti]|nr:hypothetical protein DTO013F2_334 [Penicillium roqueforti]KAI3218205.1 hypothetical protein DTO013E5_44 [Penicillium roqueforti]